MFLLMALFASPVATVVIGLDAGTSFAKVGTGRHGEGVHIALNDASKRKTPWVLAFHPEGRRVMGDDAVNLRTRFPEHTIPFPSWFLGKSYSSQGLMKTARDLHGGYAIVEDPNRWDGVLLGQGTRTTEDEQGQTGLAPEEAVGTLIRYAVRNIGMRPGDKEPEQVVMTVSSSASQATRKAALDAMAVAGLSPASLINDHAAVAIKYGMDRTFDKKPSTVMFVDHGAGGLKVSIVSFHSINTTDIRRKNVMQIRVRSVAFDNTVGGLAFDAVVADMIKRKAEAKHPGCTANARAEAKIMKEAQKARTVLSANKEYQYSLEFSETERVSGVVTRSTFEEAADPLFTQLLVPVKTAMREANVRMADLDAIELVGGAFRMPKVQTVLNEYFEGSAIKPSTSMNGEESAALGATYYAAFLAGYHIRGFNLVDIVPYTLTATIGASKEAEITKTLFAKHSAMPAMLAHTFKLEENTKNITVTLTEQGSGCDPVLCLVTPSGIEGVVRRQGYLKVDRNGLAALESVEDFLSSSTEGPLLPMQLNTSCTASDRSPSVALLKQYRHARAKWDELDREVQLNADARNDLEAFIFQTKTKVEGEEYAAMTEDQRTEVLKSLDALEEWLFDAGADVKAKVYVEKKGEVLLLLEVMLFRPAALEMAQRDIARAETVKDQLNSTNSSVLANDLDQKVKEFQTWMGQNEKSEQPNLSRVIASKAQELMDRAAKYLVDANATKAEPASPKPKAAVEPNSSTTA